MFSMKLLAGLSLLLASCSNPPQHNKVESAKVPQSTAETNTGQAYAAPQLTEGCRIQVKLSDKSPDNIKVLKCTHQEDHDRLVLRVSDIDGTTLKPSGRWGKSLHVSLENHTLEGVNVAVFKGAKVTIRKDRGSLKQEQFECSWGDEMWYHPDPSQRTKRAPCTRVSFELTSSELGSADSVGIGWIDSWRR